MWIWHVVYLSVHKLLWKDRYNTLHFVLRIHYLIVITSSHTLIFLILIILMSVIQLDCMVLNFLKKIYQKLIPWTNCLKLFMTVGCVMTLTWGHLLKVKVTSWSTHYLAFILNFQVLKLAILSLSKFTLSSITVSIISFFRTFDDFSRKGIF